MSASESMGQINIISKKYPEHDLHPHRKISLSKTLYQSTLICVISRYCKISNNSHWFSLKNFGTKQQYCQIFGLQLLKMFLHCLKAIKGMLPVYIFCHGCITKFPPKTCGKTVNKLAYFFPCNDIFCIWSHYHAVSAYDMFIVFMRCPLYKLIKVACIYYGSSFVYNSI